MSLFQTISATCPHCGTQQAFEAVFSVNADRRPDFRDAIIDGTFQFEICEKCGETFRLDPGFVYLDVARGQWISAQPAASLGDWPQESEKAVEGWAESYGDDVSPAAQEVGKGLQARVTFGWPALREKIIANAAGIDDVALELTKAALMRTQGDLALSVGRELRLQKAGEEGLQVAIVEAQSEAVIETLTLPFGFYQTIADGIADWDETAKILGTGTFVDVQKLYIGDAEDAETAAE